MEIMVHLDDSEADGKPVELAQCWRDVESTAKDRE